MFSKFLRNKLVDAILRGGSVTFPTTLYAALVVADPASDDTYQEIGSTTANGYARSAITCNATNWSATNGVGSTTNPSTGTTGKSSNNGVIAFPNPSGGNWFNGAGPAASNIVGIALFDSATIGAGNLWLYSPITKKQVRQTDFSPNVPVAGLSFGFDV